MTYNSVTVDTAGTGAALALDTTGSRIIINAIAEGSTFTQRVGRKVALKSVRLTYTVSLKDALTASTLWDDDYARVCIIYDRQTNGLMPTLPDMFTDYASNGTTTASAGTGLCGMIGLNPDNRDRFLIIADQRIYLPKVLTSAVANQPAVVVPNSYTADNMGGLGMQDIFRKLKGLVTHYKSTAAPPVVGDVATGGLYLVAFGGLAAANQAWTISNWNVRLRYVDV